MNNKKTGLYFKAGLLSFRVVNQYFINYSKCIYVDTTKYAYHKRGIFYQILKSEICGPVDLVKPSTLSLIELALLPGLKITVRK